MEALVSVSGDPSGFITVSLASAQPIASSGGVLTLEFAGDDVNSQLRLLSAQVDERTARVVTHRR